ncbi:phage late control D family protein [Zavarzinella formosa]|uniref:phage late control D family protein n=1 Tax=Zavarzinella formosa TaxID=360055 RepID=UPI00036D872E|nr:phage late control D family protein [Zavarzinella formosa]
MSLDYYIPDFRVLIHNGLAPDHLRRVITSVSLTTGLEGADRVEMTVANQARIWVDDPLLSISNPFELQMGYLPDRIVPMFSGEITGVAASFPSNGVPQVTVTAQDRRHRLKEGRQAGWHAQSTKAGNQPKPDDQVTREIAGRYDLQIRRDPSGNKLAEIVSAAAQIGLAEDLDSRQKAIRRQINQSDYELLRQIARENGLEMIVDHAAADGGKTLRFFFPPDRIEAEVELEYGYSLIEFTPRDSSVGQVRSVSTNLRVPATGKQYGISLAVNDAQSVLTLTVGTSPVPADKKDGAVVLTEPLTPATAPRRLLGELLTRTNSKVTGSGSTIGNPKIRAGTVVCLTELGLRFGGLYRVTSATHTIDGGGYKTKFEVRKEIGLNGLSAIVQKAKPLRKPLPASS